MHRFLFAAALLLTAFACQTSSDQGDPSRPDPKSSGPHVQITAAVVPGFFEKNVGQTDKAVRYLMRRPGEAVHFTPDSVVWVLGVPPQATDMDGDAEKLGETSTFASSPMIPEDNRAYALRMNILGASNGIEIKGEPLPNLAVRHYISDKAFRIPASKTVGYSQVYPGIDLTFATRNDVLSHAWKVGPHASAESIRLQFTGVTHLKIADDRSLHVKTPARTMRHSAPRAFEIVDGQIRELKAAFRILDEFTVGFEVHGRTAGAVVHIDPDVTFLESYETSTTDNPSPQMLAVGPPGVARLVFNTQGAGFPGANTGWFNEDWGNVLVCAVDMHGGIPEVLWATYVGTTSNGSIALDGQHRSYIGCWSRSFQELPQTEGSYGSSFIPGYVAGGGALVRLSADGELDRATLFRTGSHSQEFYRLKDVAVGGPGDSKVFFTGTYSAPSYPPFDPDTLALGPPQGNDDAVVAVIDSDFTELQSFRFLGGSSRDYASALTVVGDQVVVSGWTDSIDFPASPGAQQEEYEAGPTMGLILEVDTPGDTFIAKFDLDLEQTWASYDGGPQVDRVSTLIDAGPDGMLLFAPTFWDDLGPYPNPSRIQNYEADGALIESHPSFIGRTHGGAWIPPGSCILTGETDVGGQASSDAFQSELEGVDAVVALMSPNGSIDFLSYLGGSMTDQGLAVELSDPSTAFLAGVTGSTDFPVTGDSNPGGDGSSVFLARIDLGSQLDLYFDLSDVEDPVAVGEAVEYEITVSNNEDFAVSGLHWVVSFPAGLLPTTAPLGCVIDGQVVTCTAPTLAPYATETFTVTAVATVPGTHECEASVMKFGQVIREAYETTTVLADAGVQVQLTGPVAAQTQKEIMYIATITNYGSEPTSAMELDLRLNPEKRAIFRTASMLGAEVNNFALSTPIASLGAGGSIEIVVEAETLDWPGVLDCEATLRDLVGQVLDSDVVTTEVAGLEGGLALTLTDPVIQNGRLILDLSIEANPSTLFGYLSPEQIEAAGGADAIERVTAQVSIRMTVAPGIQLPLPSQVENPPIGNGVNGFGPIALSDEDNVWLWVFTLGPNAIPNIFISLPEVDFERIEAKVTSNELPGGGDTEVYTP